MIQGESNPLKRSKVSKYASYIRKPRYISRYTSGFNSGVYLKCFLEQIHTSANGMSGYKDFVLISDIKPVIKSLWPYIYTILQLDTGEIDEYFEDIKKGWEYIRGFLPLIFEFPSKDGVLEGEALIDNLRSSIEFDIPDYVMDDFMGTIAFFKDLKEEKSIPIMDFFRKHEKLSFFLNDEIDQEIRKIISSYNIAVDELLELYTEETFEEMQRIAMIDF